MLAFPGDDSNPLATTLFDAFQNVGLLFYECALIFWLPEPLCLAFYPS